MWATLGSALSWSKEENGGCSGEGVGCSQQRQRVKWPVLSLMGIGKHPSFSELLFSSLHVEKRLTFHLV